MHIRRFAFAFLLITIACRLSLGEPERLPEGARIPVLAWIGIPEKLTSDERFRELANCGFTIDFSSYSSVESAIKALDAAQAAGVKILVSCPQLQSNPADTVGRLQHHPALAGYFLVDEPKADAFADLGKWAGKIRSADANHIVYVNLLPNYATTDQLGTSTYAQYVDQSAAAIATSFLSFDFYPIVGRSVRTDWYENLEIVSAAARKVDRPFWAFALSLHHFDYPAATRENLRLEVYSDLAYGAHGIQYFTYWQPEGLGSDSPIDAKGKRTAVYDIVKQMNQEIRARSAVFAGSKVIALGHTGKSLPAGTSPFQAAAPVKSVQTEGTGAIVSHLANGSGDFLVIVNRDFEHAMPTIVTFDGSTVIHEVEHDGALTKLTDNTVRFSADPGDARIFTWHR